MGNKIKTVNGNYHMFQCPGCGYHHSFNNSWSYNGDPVKPTVHPSLLVNKDDPRTRCHSFITDGKIQFLNDCFHDLKGQTVDLPDWEE